MDSSSENSTTGDRRSEREAEFHDARFSENEGERASSKFYRLTGPSERAFANKIAEIRAPSSVLELGCGPDSVAWGLIKRGIDVTGIDISAEAISIARSKARDQGESPDRFITMNAECLDFPDDSFDAVIGSSILHHLSLEDSLAGLRRVLRPGGHAIFYEPLGFNPIINLYRRFTPNDRSADERPFTESDLALVGSAFTTLELDYFHLTSLTALAFLKTRLFEPTSKGLERLDQSIMSRFPSLRKFSWVVVIDGRA